MGKNDLNRVSFAYSMGLLRTLMEKKVITRDEYERIAAISQAYYDVDLYCV